MTLTFKHKIMLLPVVAAVFLVAILGVSLVLGYSTRQANVRIGQGYAPALALSQALEAQLAAFHSEVQDEALMMSADRREVLRTLERKLKADLQAARGNPMMDSALVDTLARDFAEYRRQAELAVELADRQDAQAPAALVEAGARYSQLQKGFRSLITEHQRRLRGAFAEVDRLHLLSQVALAVLVVLCIASLGGLSYWLVREVVGPLTRLSETASRMATEGDLTLTVDVHSRDEIGQLARSLEAVMERLRSVPVALKELVEELATAAERLTKVSQEQINFLAEQARSLSEAGTTMAEIAQTSNVAASRAEMVLKVASQADAFTASSQQSIEQSAQGLEQIRQRVNALVGSIGHLSEQAVHAGAIISSVKDLADQSNVLALNAAIEAARAGEGGRGFAVVAREMRALSGQSLKSTQRIGGILLEISQAIRQTVTAAEGDSQQMEAGIEQVLASADRLKEITNVMQESSRAARQIVASVTQQNAGISQMTEVMTQLSQMMGDVVSATTTAEETVGQINSTVTRLREIVSGFRV